MKQNRKSPSRTQPTPERSPNPPPTHISVSPELNELPINEQSTGEKRNDQKSASTFEEFMRERFRPPKTRGDFLKLYLRRYAWRATAIYIWLRFIFTIGGQAETINELESGFTTRLTDFLSSIGFAPVSAASLITVLKIGWVLVIVGFRPLGLLKLFLYILFFPLLIILYTALLIFIRYTNRHSSKNKDKKEKDADKARSTSQSEIRGLGLRRAGNRYPFLTLCGGALLGWIILYGSADSFRAIALGAFLSGLFLLLFIFRLFKRAKPPHGSNTEAHPWLEGVWEWSSQLLRSAETIDEDSSEGAKGAAMLHRIFRFIPIRIAAASRRRGAYGAVSTFVLGEYILSLIIVATTAILFWALVIKLIAPPLLPLALCLHISASHFLPGVSSPVAPINLPLWASIGPASTAWVLFVLYIGPAGSLLPDRQRVYMKRLSNTYRLFRSFTVICTKKIKAMERLAKVLSD